jgi:hypothetical protein
MIEPSSLRLPVPAITTWTRLEPKPRDASLQRSLQAQVRDAAWFLARQWQLGEFAGEDAGSPVEAAVSVLSQPLTSFQPGNDAAATVAYDPTLPLEARVEREPVTLKLRAAVQLGLWFERKLRAASVTAASIELFRTAFPIASATADDTVYDGVDGAAFRALATGRVTNGSTLFLAATGASGAPAMPAIATSDPAIKGAVSAFIAYRTSLFSEPQNERAWQPQELAYDFAVGSATSGGTTLLTSQGFGGGHLDWYDFDVAAAGTAASPPPTASMPATVAYAFLPQHVTFRGMPEPRWWTFESGTTDFGALDTEPVDLAKMLVMEFALTYGNDWFVLGIPGTVGTLSTIDTLVVTDTFGQRTIIRSADQTQVVPGQPVWSMFKLSGLNSRSPFLLMPPSVDVTDDGPALESVDFLRDKMAAMAWAVEHDLDGTLDAPVDAYQAYLARIARDPVPNPVAQPGDPPVYYSVESVIPDNWIPLIAVITASGQRVFRRGLIEHPEGSGFVASPARASVLEPGAPFYLTDRIITSIGTVATAAFRRARGVDGTTYLWRARASKPGAGPGWSGLRFDYLQRFDGTSANP